MKYKALIPFAFVAFFTMQLNLFSAANSVVSGRITDYDSGTPLSAASVSLHKIQDSAIVTGKITDRNGSFAFNDLPDDNYFLKVNYVGYETKYISPIAITKTTQLVEYGNIGLLQTSSVTGEIVITAEKPLIEFQMGKQILNVDKNLTATNGNAIDVLKTAPSVEVNQDGQVSLRGSSNVKIFIDGKPSPVSGSNLVNILEQIPAGSIDNIELITNPSAKYDAAGMSGIINIVLKKKRDTGLNGVGNINIGNGDKYSTGLNLNYNTGSMNVFGNYDFSSHIRKTGQDIEREVYSPLGTSYLTQDGRNSHNSKRHYGKLGVDYSFDNFNYLMVSGGYNNAGNRMVGNFDYLSTDYNGIVSDINLRRYYVKQPQISYDATANYKRTFETKGHELNVDVYYNEFDLDNNSNNRLIYFNPDGTNDNTKLPFLQNIKSLNNVKSTTLQTDYIHPLSSNSKLEAGAKANLKTYSSNNNYFNYDYQSYDWLIDNDASNNFKYDEQVYSIYAMYSGMYKNFNYQAGLRGEQTETKGDLKTTGETFSNSYFDLFPSLVLSYKFTMTDQVQLSYSRRVDRPATWFVNPFKDKSDPKSVRSGNPDLKPVYSNSYELGYIKYFGNHVITPSLFFRQSFDVMTMYSRYNADDDKVYHTYMNYSDGLSYGLDLSYQARATSWLSLGANLSYYRQEVTVKTPEMADYNKDEYSWNGRINGNITFMKDLSGQFFAMYIPKTVTPQGSRHESYWVDFAIKYDILDSDASLTFKVNNIFDTQKWGGYAKGDGFRFTNSYLPESQVMSLGFTYKINNGLKPQRQRVRSTQDQNPPSDMF